MIEILITKVFSNQKYINSENVQNKFYWCLNLRKKKIRISYVQAYVMGEMDDKRRREERLGVQV